MTDRNDAVLIDADDASWEENLTTARFIVGSTIMTAMTVFLIVYTFMGHTSKLAEVSVELAAFDGLDATLGRTVSPAFNLTVHVKNTLSWQAWCSNGGEVVVSYSGVALAWGDVPVFCVPRSATTELTVLPWGWEVGLSEDLHRRLVSESQMHTAEVLLEVRMFDPGSWMLCETETHHSMSLHRFKLMLRDSDG
ncbi:hypothetical protein VPH35_045009 [Triticum aestivum]|uniref:uncharacterized protein isoform X1 n=1 Tax=Triticum aestivum TaxID=4565 RepID=UPI001D01BFEA|nr:uncharacterized protein LOC123058451 isoform X1 [Triticum aestivum]